MDACTSITASRGSIYPPVVARKTPTETDYVENDIAADVDCEEAGITLISSLWAIHPDDDDATLTLGPAVITGLITRQVYSAGTAGKSYRLVNTVETSDGRTLEYTTQVAIAETLQVIYRG